MHIYAFFWKFKYEKSNMAFYVNTNEKLTFNQFKWRTQGVLKNENVKKWHYVNFL